MIGLRRTLCVAAAALIAMLSSACTDADDGAGGDARRVVPRHEWCDVFESLELPEDAPDIELTDAPVELQVTLQFLAEIEVELEEARKIETYPADEEAAGAVEARTTVEAWGQQHCGSPDPFCSLWTSFDRLVKADPTEVPVQFAVRTLDDELLQYAPDDQVHAVQDHLVALHATFIGTPVPSDYRESDGETAYAELRAWVREHCSTGDGGR